MNELKLIHVLVILIAICAIPNCFAQSDKKDSVQLLSWQSYDCDDTYDPFLLKNRISKYEKVADALKMTVNFSENCCTPFEPTIDFVDNKLYLIPVTSKNSTFCDCRCCFSIEFTISGLGDEDFEVYFDGSKIEYSENHYDTIAPTSKIYNGQQINRKNKYGFHEGIWMTFYENNKIESIRQFPESVLYVDAWPIWIKYFHPSGSLQYYNRNDTIQEWFEDGTLLSEQYPYSVGDTSFDYSFRLYKNRTLKEKSLQRIYPVIHRSNFNDCYKAEGEMLSYAYKETYYENGQKDYLQLGDTIHSWYSNGQLRRYHDPSKGIKFDSLGRITEKMFFWFSPGAECSKDLNNSLTMIYDNNLNITEVRLLRDEVIETAIELNRTYYWKWNETGELIHSPKIWNEPLPWIKFETIKFR